MSRCADRCLFLDERFGTVESRMVVHRLWPLWSCIAPASFCSEFSSPPTAETRPTTYDFDS